MVRQVHLLIGLLKGSLAGTLLVIDKIIYFSVFFYFLYAENKHYRIVCITILTDVTGWPEQTKIKYTYNLGGQRLFTLTDIIKISLIFV